MTPKGAVAIRSRCPKMTSWEMGVGPSSITGGACRAGAGILGLPTMSYALAPPAAGSRSEASLSSWSHM
eukprot:11322927-Heterocapsa_arctica.AAC.1